jgi:hypothetical protein
MAVTTSPTPRSTGMVAIIAVTLGGCPTPAQEGGLARIDNEGFARRFQLVCSSGHADPSCAPAVDASTDDETRDGEVDVAAPEAAE